MNEAKEINSTINEMNGSNAFNQQFNLNSMMNWIEMIVEWNAAGMNGIDWLIWFHSKWMKWVIAVAMPSSNQSMELNCLMFWLLSQLVFSLPAIYFFSLFIKNNTFIPFMKQIN